MSTPTLVDHTKVKMLQQVEGGRVTEETPAGKKKRPDESPKAQQEEIQQQTYIC